MHSFRRHKVVRVTQAGSPIAKMSRKLGVPTRKLYEWLKGTPFAQALRDAELTEMISESIQSPDVLTDFQ